MGTGIAQAQGGGQARKRAAGKGNLEDAEKKRAAEYSVNPRGETEAALQNYGNTEAKTGKEKAWEGAMGV